MQITFPYVAQYSSQPFYPHDYNSWGVLSKQTFLNQNVRIVTHICACLSPPPPTYLGKNEKK